MRSICLLFTLFFFAFGFLQAQTKTTDMYGIVEEMPRFPGCENEPKEDRKECAQKKMLEFVYRNLEYPKQAKKAKVEGMVVAQFVVNKNGDIEDVTIIRKLGNGCDEEVKRVMEKMNNMSQKWIPGKQGEKVVDVKYVFPVKFKLEAGKRA